MANALVSQGLDLMLVGMGVVFVFLALLVVITVFMSAIIQKYFPTPTPAAIDSPPSPLPEPRILAAIKAAIKEHRAAKP